MRFIKLGLISIVFFSLLLTGMSLLLPSTIHISRAIDINAPLNIVYTNINNIAKWKNWYADYDSSNATLSSVAVGKGAILTTNKATVTIIETSPLQIKALWQMGNNNALPGEFNFSQSNGSGTTLQWHFTQTVKWYPWQKFASIVSDKTIGPFMEKSLDNLKREAEKH